jgi:hypothetical protein
MPTGDNFWGRAVKEESGLRESKEKHTPFFGVLFEITRGEYIDKDGKRQSVVGKRYSYDGWMTPDSQERTLQSLIYCGLDVRGGATLQNPIGIDKNEVPLTLEEETYQDPNDANKWKTRTRVAWVNDPARAASIHARMGEAEATSFSQKMQGELEATFAKLQSQKGAAKPQGSGTSFDFGANAPKSGAPPAAGDPQAPAAQAAPAGDPPAPPPAPPPPQATQPDAAAKY